LGRGWGGFLVGSGRPNRACLKYLQPESTTA